MSPRSILAGLLLAGITAGHILLWLQPSAAPVAANEDTGPAANPLLPAPSGQSVDDQEKKMLQDRITYLETQLKALQQENSGLVDKLASLGTKGGDKAMAAPSVMDGGDNVSLGIELLAFRKLDDVPLPTVESPQQDVEKLILQSLLKRWGPDFGQKEGAAFAALGLIPQALDTLPLRAGLLARQITGWYDEPSDTLHIVRAGKDGELIPTKPVLAVAYGALLHRYGQNLYASTQTTDERLAREAMIAGDATLTNFLYSLQKPSPPSPLDDLPADDPDHPLNQVIAPAFLRDLMVFPLAQGFSFAQALHSVGGWDQVSAAYTRLPASSAEILDDELYLSDHSLPPPQITWKDTQLAGAEPFWDDRLGQHGIRLMMARYNESDIAAKVSLGWRMDRWLAYTGKTPTDRGHAVWLTQWANPDSARSFQEALLPWLAQHYQAEPKITETTLSLSAKGRSIQVLRKESSVLFIDTASAELTAEALKHFAP
jgi:hypothetical protein